MAPKTMAFGFSTVVVFFLGGCTSWRTVPESPTSAIQRLEPSTVRLTHSDGRTRTIERPAAEGGTAVGTSQIRHCVGPLESLPGEPRCRRETAELRVPLEEIREAAVPANEWSLGYVPLGADLRVSTSDGGQAQGELASVTSDELVLVRHRRQGVGNERTVLRSEARVPIEDISNLRVNLGRHIRKGAAVGAGIAGTVAGIGWAFACSQLEGCAGDEMFVGAVFGTIAGAAAGAIVGALVPNRPELVGADMGRPGTVEPIPGFGLGVRTVRR